MAEVDRLQAEVSTISATVTACSGAAAPVGDERAVQFTTLHLRALEHALSQVDPAKLGDKS